MKSILCLLFSLLMYVQANSQDFVRLIDKKTNKVMLQGKISFNDLMDETTYKWFGKTASEYTPNEEAIMKIKELWGIYRFIVFAGTWCEDTQYLLPRFYKVLQDARIDMNAVQMYAVDRNKETLNLEHKLYNIQRVPTIIVMHQYREVGRIIESVSSTIEDELEEIIEQDIRNLAAKRAAKVE